MAATMRKEKENFCFVLIALLIVQMGFGAYGVIVTKYAKNAHVDPLVFCLIRDGGCFPVLFLASYIAEKKLLIPNKRDLPVIAGSGFIGMFLNQLCYLLGVYYTSPDIASMFQPFAPVWTVILAVLMRVEKVPKINTVLGASKILGILLAVSGAVLMNFGKSSLSENNSGNNLTTGKSFFGYLALLGNTFSMSLYVLIQKKYIFSIPTSRWKDNPVNVTAWSYFFGFVSMCVASLYYVNKPEKFQIHSKEVVFTFIYAIFVTSALCYILVTWCNMIVSSSFVTASWPLQVFFCIILSYFVLGETLSANEWIGGGMILVSMLTIVWSNYRQEIMLMSREAVDNHDDRRKLMKNETI